MNKPPEEYIRVPYEKLHDFVSTAGQTVGLPQDKADSLADKLTGNDLRGVFSHGTQQITTYTRLMRDGQLNNTPQIEVVRETGNSLLVDGDGGLGYFPAHAATLGAIEKAKDQGMAIAMTRNHGHFGAAGLYSRMTLGHDLIAYVTSGHQLQLEPGGSLYDAAGGSPMSFAAPAAEEASLVLDFGAMHDLYGGSRRDEIEAIAPGLVLRCIGMGEICQSWGGLLAGLPIDGAEPEWRKFPGATQGSMVMVCRIELFHDADEFKAKMDEYVRRVRKLQPLKGFEQSFMPGGIEAQREQECRRDGVPMGERHRKQLEGMATELAIAVPW